MSDAAQLMDRMYRRQRHIYDLSRKFYLLGRDEAIAGLHAGPGVSVLEIGCGTGRNLVKLARAYPGAHLFGLDVSREMLASAAAAMARAGLSARVALGQGDATAFDSAALFGRARFDRVMISYALSMIPPWREALERGARRSCARRLAASGRLRPRRRAARPVQDRIAPLARRLRCDPARRSRRRARGALGRARPDVQDRDPVPRLRRSGGRAPPFSAQRGRWPVGPDGVSPTAATQVWLQKRQRERAPVQTCFPHPIRPYGPPSPAKLGKGSGGLSRRTPARG